MRRRGSAIRLHPQRLIWLSAHPECTVGVPSINDDVDDAGRQALTVLVARLHAEGLLGASGYMVNRDTVRNAIAELRGEKITEHYW